MIDQEGYCDPYIRPMDQLYISNDRYTPLMCSCNALAVEEVVARIATSEVNAVNRHGETALHVAARNSYTNDTNAIEIIKMLLDAGADVNARAEYGLTVLMYAAIYGTAKVVQVLLDRGADVNLRNDEGTTVLSLVESIPAVARRSKRTISYIEAAGGMRSSSLPAETPVQAQNEASDVGTSNMEELSGDHLAILGQWKLVAVVQDDLKLKHADIGKTFEFTSKFFHQLGKTSGYEYDLYPEQSPKSIDFFVSRPDGMVNKGIYELEGDDLRMLFESKLHDGGKRPTSMTGLAGHPHHVVKVYKRKNR